MSGMGSKMSVKASLSFPSGVACDDGGLVYGVK